MLQVKESDNVTYFSSDEEKLNRLKEWGLISAVVGLLMVIRFLI